MIDPDLEEAVVVFEQSRVGNTPGGLAAAAKLREYVVRDRIHYDPLTPTKYGLSDSRWVARPPYIKVNEGFRGDVASTSLVLAHEAVHRAMNTSSIDEELACFELQDNYYTELLSGVTYTSATRKSCISIKLTSQFPGIGEAHRWRAKNQLIDYILAMDVYSSLLTAKWVQMNITKWGGLSNRWATTRGNFVRVLGSDVLAAQLILKIMASITRRSDWDEMMRTAGDLDAARRALRLCYKAPSAGLDIRIVEQRWKIKLNVR